MSDVYKCQECGVTLQALAELCVRCFHKLHKPCPRCMVRWVGDRWHARLDKKTKKAVDCSYCNNERWILAR